MKNRLILGMKSLKNATYEDEKWTFNSRNKTKVFIKSLLIPLNITPHLPVHKYQHDSSFAVQILLLNPSFLSIRYIQLLFFTLGHSNFLEKF